MLTSLKRSPPLVSGLSNGVSAGGGLAGILARDRAWAIVSSSSAMWQRWASRSGFLGLGGGFLELFEGLVALLLGVVGGAGAGRLVEGCGFLALALAWTAGMLLGRVVAGGSGAGRRRGMERGGGGRGGGERDCRFSLTSFSFTLIEDFPGFLSPLPDRPGQPRGQWRWRVWRKCGFTKHSGPLECRLSTNVVDKL